MPFALMPLAIYSSREFLAGIDYHGLRGAQLQRLLADFFKIISLLADIDRQRDNLGLIFFLDPFKHRGGIQTS